MIIQGYVPKFACLNGQSRMSEAVSGTFLVETQILLTSLAPLSLESRRYAEI